MNINKALKKERKSKKRLFIVMILLFIILPLITYLEGLRSLFILAYLGIIEILIVLVLLIKSDYYSLKFVCNNNRLKIKSGLFIKESSILCDKVSIVHTNKEKDELEIIIVTSVKSKNKGLKPITQGFIKRYPEAGEEYLRVKKIRPENTFYFQVIRRGAFKKYELLDTIYKNCVRATYTASAIENIKIARGQIEF